MTRVAVVGGESTGGRLLRRLLEPDDRLTVQHWSFPHGPRTAGTFWPIGPLADFDPDFILVTVRGWEPMLASKKAHHQPDAELAESEVQLGYQKLFTYLSLTQKPWRFVVYEFLVAYPHTAMEGCWTWLGCSSHPITEPIYDADEAWENSVPL